jgi:hypothetical protein
MHPTIALFALGLLASSPCLAQDSGKPLFNVISKDKLVRRKVFANGDYCQVREYAGDEHIGIRVVYFLAERSVDESDVRSLIKKLATEYCGKREAPLILTAVDKFKPANSADHWMINLQNRDYAEFFIAVHWLGESVTIQIKYYK